MMNRQRIERALAEVKAGNLDAFRDVIAETAVMLRAFVNFHVVTVKLPWMQTQKAISYQSPRSKHQVGLVQAKLPDGTPFGSVTAIAAGAHHTVMLKTDGTLVVWGQGGNPSGGAVTLPDGTPLAGVSAIAAGGQHTVAIVGE